MNTKPLEIKWKEKKWHLQVYFVFMVEPGINSHDRNAVAVEKDRNDIGNLPRSVVVA